MGFSKEISSPLAAAVRLGFLFEAEKNGLLSIETDRHSLHSAFGLVLSSAGREIFYVRSIWFYFPLFSIVILFFRVRRGNELMKDG